jgi:hypothetical protein
MVGEIVSALPLSVGVCAVLFCVYSLLTRTKESS